MSNFICTDCKIQFINKSNLNRHKKTHTMPPKKQKVANQKTIDDVLDRNIEHMTKCVIKDHFYAERLANFVEENILEDLPSVKEKADLGSLAGQRYRALYDTIKSEEMDLNEAKKTTTNEIANFMEAVGRRLPVERRAGLIIPVREGESAFEMSDEELKVMKEDLLLEIRVVEFQLKRREILAELTALSYLYSRFDVNAPPTFTQG